MAVHSSCPKCQKQVLVPEGAGDAIVRCPLCHEEYELSEAHALLAPALIVVRPGTLSPVAAAAAGGLSGTPLLQEREHVVPISVAHDAADEFKFSDEAASPFHIESPVATAHDGGDIAFEPALAFEPVAEPFFGGATGQADEHAPPAENPEDNLFGAEMFAETAHGDSSHGHNGDGIEMLHEPEAVEEAPWHPSSWDDAGEHAAGHEHEHEHGDDIGIAEDHGMSAVDFASMTGKSAEAGDEAGATPAKKKKRKQTSGGGFGRLVGVIVSGAMAVPCVGLLGAVIGEKTDVFKIRPYMQNVPYLNKIVGGPPKTSASAPSTNVANNANPKAAPGNAVAPAQNNKANNSTYGNASKVPGAQANTQPEANPVAPPAGKPETERPNTPFGEDHADAANVNGAKPKENGPKATPPQVTEAKKPEIKQPEPDNVVASVEPPKKSAGKPADEGDDPFGAKPDAKPDATPNPDDPLGTPAKPDAGVAAPEIKPIGPVPIAPGPIAPAAKPDASAPKLDEMPAVPQAKPEVKPENSKKPAGGDAGGEDPFNNTPEAKPATPQAKPEVKPENSKKPAGGDAGGEDPFNKTPEVKPAEPKPSRPELAVPPPEVKPEIKLETPKPSTEIPAKPELKPAVAPEIKPEVKPTPIPEIKPELKPDVAPEPRSVIVLAMPAVGPKVAPSFEASALGQALTKTTAPAQITAAAYGDLCKLAEMATYVKAGGDTEKKAVGKLLTTLAADPQAAAKMNALAKSRLADTSTTGGVVVSGSVMVSLKKGDLYGTAIKIEGQAAPVMVFSSHSLDIKADDKVIVPGAIVRDPAKNLPGYPGKQPVIVWTDRAVKLP